MDNAMPAQPDPNGMMPATDSDSILGLAVQGLTKRFGSLTAVDRLSFVVNRGQILALLGPNGAGKTTTLLCLAGLLRPDQGRISWEGQLLGPERSRSMALIPETPEVYEMLTVWEHLVFTAKSCRVAPGWEQRAQALIDRLDLTSKRDTLGDNLSKGMRQKLLLACAVLAGTPVMLLDEPMIGLDPRGQRELKDLLLELRQQGTAIVVSTHLLEYIDAICDELLILKDGQKMAAGPLQEVLAERGGRSLEDVFLEITR